MNQSWGSVEKLVAMEGYEDFADTGVLGWEVQVFAVIWYFAVQPQHPRQPLSCISIFGSIDPNWVTVEERKARDKEEHKKYRKQYSSKHNTDA